MDSLSKVWSEWSFLGLRFDIDRCVLPCGFLLLLLKWWFWAGLLGSVAPCVLYGSTAERLGSTPGTFANHCLPYTGLYLLGNSLFGGNWLAPWLSYGNRTAIRRRFNLEGSCEAFTRSCGCCGCFIEDDVQREHCETACDFATHVFCHACALCQEGREVRRRLPHPGFNAQPVLIMIPPAEQTMGRVAWMLCLLKLIRCVRPLYELLNL